MNFEHCTLEQAVVRAIGGQMEGVVVVPCRKNGTPTIRIRSEVPWSFPREAAVESMYFFTPSSDVAPFWSRMVYGPGDDLQAAFKRLGPIAPGYRMIVPVNGFPDFPGSTEKVAEIVEQLFADPFCFFSA